MCVIGHYGVRFLTNQKIFFCRIIKEGEKMAKNYESDERYCQIWNEVFISMKHIGLKNMKEVRKEAVRIYEKSRC